MSSFLQLLTQPPPIFTTHPLFFAVLLSLLLVFLTKCLLLTNLTTTTATRNLPPSPLKLPLIGHFHHLGLLAHRSLQSLAQKHGPIMLLQLGRVPTLVISSPEAAREIMKTHDLAFSDRARSSTAKRLLYNYKDLSMAPYGEYWRQLKSIYVLQLLSNRRVHSFHDVREEEIALMVEKIEGLSSSCSVVDLSKTLMSVTSDVIYRAVMGTKFGDLGVGERFRRLMRDLLKLLGDVDIGDFVPWLGWINSVNGFHAKIDRVAKGLDGLLEAIVAERVNGVKREEGNDGGGDVEIEGSKNFFDILLQIYQDGAGTDTTYTLLEWAMSELLRNPRVMKKLQHEVREILAGKSKIVEDDLEKMQYLKAVIKETLRLRPPIPLLVPREARQDTKVMGYDVAAGTMVITNMWAIGRDPGIWDEPEEFRPERFLNSSVDFKGQDFQLIPFGAGRRGCPGISFAMVTSELVLANLMCKFDWALPGGARAEDLDMTETIGATHTEKKSPSCPCNPMFMLVKVITSQCTHVC
ncbi:cytochrome P450, family 71, subfamily A, polypeptide 22 [Actinidia rufa]|uniref:Cytochrome P450, family 71, subfamily A, polypeptide 22 n=1 Tax=Actinidia rufa TaxID=165716 RepID=A0A7J0FYS8_9ERIC|nr:cytochrome P450, family 71, subfamily A, polypeptide 22 [Actinidia rufa]